MDKSKTPQLIELAIYIALGLTFYYVAFHFISKYW